MISLRRALDKSLLISTGCFHRVVSPSNLIACFKACGVYPFDNQAVHPITVGKNGEDFEL